MFIHSIFNIFLRLYKAKNSGKNIRTLHLKGFNKSFQWIGGFFFI